MSNSEAVYRLYEMLVSTFFLISVTVYCMVSIIQGNLGTGVVAGVLGIILASVLIARCDQSIEMLEEDIGEMK